MSADIFARADQRYRNGLDLLKTLPGESAAMVTSRLAEVAPEVARLAVEFGYGDLFSRPALDLKAREIAAISALGALGNAAPQLRAHVASALGIGVARAEIVEVLMQLAFSAGFPAAINALTACHDLLTDQATSCESCASDSRQG